MKDLILLLIIITNFIALTISSDYKLCTILLMVYVVVERVWSKIETKI